MSEKAGFFKRHKKPLIVIVVVAVLAAIVVGNMNSRREKAVKVTIEKVSKRDLTSIVSASGEIKPKKNINISAQVPGRIVRIGVVEGQEVKAGDFLLKLDSTQYEANADRDRNFIRAANADLIQTEARLQLDKSSYDRQQQLFADNLISKEQLETAKAAYDVSVAQANASRFQIKQAEASLTSTLDSLAKTTYISPIDGIITSLQVEEGETAIIGTMNNPGTVMLTIADLSVMEVEVEVDETDVIGVALGQGANVRVDALPETVFKGKVTEIGSSAIQQSTSGLSSSTQESKDFKVVVTLDDPDRKLKPGLSASADIIVAQRSQTLAVPISALVLRDKPNAPADAPGAAREEEGVYAVEAGRVKFAPVAKGITGGMNIEIVSGLREGQEIVSGPYASLRGLKDGVLVRPEARKDAKTP
ncbi:MAG TPA: efflux RND transporter periplasmic adaptor subunit [Candidatus Aminicenantes bacterium]|nr:efflux RND transporter periplasmic adaptor subunit [Candidatus Aminicenantes bacterium]HRY63746.1 efflux RND transporter periplasmic adaptor subunit [Candidatus Aminicenantes bacterium]HRZ70659.1 efflux RND transporter periplasmic adaptor subunit [Candidatus Aminicenantes bacterium]